MTNKKDSSDVEKLKEELLNDYKEHLDKLFAAETFDLTFDEREKLIDKAVNKNRCKILTEHLEKDPDGVSKNNYHPDESSLCQCGACAPLHRDKNGEPKVFKREIKTKGGSITVQEYGYYCSQCRRIFFPSPKKAGSVQRKLQP